MAYDAFLSHNHADKAWARQLCRWLQHSDYDGRDLRVWLDEQVLDPDARSEVQLRHDLGVALHDSRVLALVLSPESNASAWVRYEIDRFLAVAGLENVVVIRRRPCDVPKVLERATVIEWPPNQPDDQPREQMLQLLRPAERNRELGGREFAREIRHVFHSGLYAQPAGTASFNPHERYDALANKLLEHDIDELNEEGPAVRAFRVAGTLLAELDDATSYHLRMALGECLAIAQLRSLRYRRVAAEFVERDLRTSRDGPSFLTVRNRALAGRSGAASTTHRLFAVARAASKLAETEPSRLDVSTLWAVLRALDQRQGLDTQAELVAMMVSRATGKLRGTAVGEVLLHAVIRSGGAASLVAAAGAITTRFEEEDGFVYYTHELAERGAQALSRAPVLPPSGSSARLLRDRSSRFSSHNGIELRITNAREDLERYFPRSWEADDPLGAALRPGPRFAGLVNGPLAGRVRLVSRQNMDALAPALGPADVAVFTEPRIVDSLFEGIGGYVTTADEVNDAMRERLARRGARFATIDSSRLDGLGDGAALAVWQPEPASAADPVEALLLPTGTTG